MSLKIRILIFAVSFLFIILMPLLLLYFLGYEAKTKWNEGALETNGTVLDRTINQDTCTESCNCDDKGCDICYYDCWIVILRLNYTDFNNKTWDESVEASSYLADYDKALDIYNYFPIGKVVTCYYQKDDPSDVKMRLEKPIGYLIATGVVGGLGFIAIIAYVIVEIFCF